MHGIPMKKKSRSKFFTCFRSSADAMNGTIKSTGKASPVGEPVFGYLTVGDQKKGVGVVFPRVLPASFSSGRDDHEFYRRKKKDGRGGCLRILKAVLFETSLAKKLRKRRFRQKSTKKTHQRKNHSSLRNENLQKNQVTSNSKFEEKTSVSNSSSFSSSTSCTSSTFTTSNSVCSTCSTSRGYNPISVHDINNISLRSNSSSTTGLTRFSIRPQENGKRCSYNGYNSSGWCLLLISLLGLAFWGKVCAICCASAWLIFLPCRNIIICDSRNKVDTLERTDSQDYKKMVIMRGLLSRDRSFLRGVN